MLLRFQLVLREYILVFVVFAQVPSLPPADSAAEEMAQEIEQMVRLRLVSAFCIECLKALGLPQGFEQGSCYR